MLNIRKAAIWLSVGSMLIILIGTAVICSTVAAMSTIDTIRIYELIK